MDAELCAGCGSCAGSCQFAAISADDGFAGIDAFACMGCGVYASHCPQEAICLPREPVKDALLEIQRPMAEAKSTAQD
jgi:heterodisulfide reductase subunit A-like polyferredoxin